MSLAGKSFDGFDFPAFCLDCEDQAAIDGLAVEQNGAGSTVAIVTALFGTSQTDLVTEHLQQTMSRLAEELFVLAINRCGDVNLSQGDSPKLSVAEKAANNDVD